MHMPENTVKIIGFGKESRMDKSIVSVLATRDYFNNFIFNSPFYLCRKSVDTYATLHNQ